MHGSQPMHDDAHVHRTPDARRHDACWPPQPSAAGTAAHTAAGVHGPRTAEVCRPASAPGRAAGRGTGTCPADTLNCGSPCCGGLKCVWGHRADKGVLGRDRQAHGGATRWLGMCDITARRACCCGAACVVLGRPHTHRPCQLLMRTPSCGRWACHRFHQAVAVGTSPRVPPHPGGGVGWRH